MAPAGCFGTRVALTPAPRMAAYDDGSSAAAGSGEIEMEMQELIVDFTDDGRILLEVKGVKVGNDKSTYSERRLKTHVDVVQQTVFCSFSPCAQIIISRSQVISQPSQLLYIRRRAGRQQG